MQTNKIKVLLVAVDLNNSGGVANYYRTILDKFTYDIEYFPVGARTGENFLKFPIRFIKDYRNFLRKIKINRYDVVHINPSLNLKSVVRDGIFLFLSHKHDIKTIVFFRGWSKSFENTIDKYFLKLFTKIYFKADRIIVLSNLFKETLLKWGYIGQISVETTIVDDAYFNNSLKPKGSNNPDELRLLYLSRVETKKGIYEALSSFSYLKNKFPKIKLTVAGEGKDLHRAKEIIKKNNVSDVNFIGYVSGSEKEKAYLDSDIYLFPSHEEGMPNSVLEAMAFGLSVVTTPVGGLQDFFVNGEMGFMTDNFTSEAIANMAEILIVDENLRCKISLNNKKYANEHFKASVVAARIEKFYTEVININVFNQADFKLKNVLIFGNDFFPFKKNSEINFWNDIVNHISKKFNKIVILSINHRPIKQETIGKNIHIFNIKPYYFVAKGNEHFEYSGNKFNKLPFAVFHKSYTFLKYIPYIQQIIDEHDIGVVHFMRIFGFFSQRLIKNNTNVIFSITVPTHIDRMFPLHNFYHLLKNSALDSMDMIIPTSQATFVRLRELGIDQEKMKVIPWGSDLSESNHINCYEKYDIPTKKKIILWSGPLQDIGKKEFKYAMKIAKKICELTEKYFFIFTIKEDKFESYYNKMDSKYKNILITKTNFNEFVSLRKIADLFLSPVCNKNRTVAPPLTWIEMMQLGIPVITTDVKGTNEIVIDGKSGFIVDGIEKTVNLLLNLKEEELKNIKENAKKIVEEKYNIKLIAQNYLNMWENGYQAKVRKNLNVRH